MKPRRRFLKKRFIFFGFLSLVLTSAFLLNGGLFRVKTVQVDWSDGKFEEPDLNGKISSELNGQNIFFVQLRDRVSLEKEFPVVSRLLLSKHYPSSVRVTVITREPLAAVTNDFVSNPVLQKFNEASDSAVIKTDYKSLWLDSLATAAPPSVYLLDKSGTLFKQALLNHFSSLPKIFLLSPVLSLNLSEELKSDADPGFFKSLPKLFLGLAADPSLKIDYVLYRGTSDLAVKFSSGFYVFLPEENDYQRTLEILNLIVGKYSMEGKNLKEVDLRFKNPVVEY